MKFKLSTPFRFAPVQVTALALVLYAAVFIGVLYCDELQSVPKDTHGLDLERAYEALSTVRLPPSTAPGPLVHVRCDSRRSLPVPGRTYPTQMTMFARTSFPAFDPLHHAMNMFTSQTICPRM